MKKFGKIMLISMFLLTITSCKKNNEVKEDKVKEEYKDYYICERLLELHKFDEESGELIKDETIENENNEIQNYSVNYVYYKDDLVKELKSFVKMKYFSEEIYKSIIKEEEFMKDKTKDDIEMSISYSEGNPTDLTKDGNGNEQNIKIDEYITNLRKIGYKCDKNT